MIIRFISSAMRLDWAWLGTDGAPAWLGKRIVTDSPAGIIQTAIPCRKEKTKAGLEALVFLVYRERAGEGTLATGTLYVRYIWLPGGCRSESLRTNYQESQDRREGSSGEHQGNQGELGPQVDHLQHQIHICQRRSHLCQSSSSISVRRKSLLLTTSSTGQKVKSFLCRKDFNLFKRKQSVAYL